MDSRSQNDSDGGGGNRGRTPTPPSNGSPAAMPHDERRPQTRPSQNGEGSADAGNGLLPVLSLEQIRITGSSNEYTEGPTVAQRSPAAPKQRENDSVTSSGSRTEGQQETWEERPNNLRNLHALIQHDNAAVVPLPSGGEDSRSSVRTSVGSASSGQRLVSGEQIIRSQPKRFELNSDELKPLNDEPITAAASEASKGPDIHSDKCEDCGRCRCAQCRRPRSLPSCWTCGRRCVCSAQNAVEYGTCVCCVKGLFYHCSSDDEDTCSDKPFSCTQSHCCARWAAVSLLSLIFPCILLYLPAKGCVAACQRGYDRATRPGCRCRNSEPLGCEEVGKLT